MPKTDFIVRLKGLKELDLFKKAIRTEVIENGLDKPIANSLSELRTQLHFLINQKIPAISGSNMQAPVGLPNLNMARSDQELIQHFTGIDLDKIRKTQDYTSGIESEVLISHEYRVKLRLAIDPNEDIEENYQKAIKFFNHSIMMFKGSSGRYQYYMNPGIDLTQWVKIVCSRDNGITERSKGKFEQYKSSNKMTRQSDSDTGRFVEWSLQQEGVKLLLKNFINITPVMEELKRGNYDEASFLLGMNKNGNKVSQFQDKIKDLKSGKNLGSTTSSYTNVVQLIANLRVKKEILKESVTYTLISNYNNEEKGMADFNYEITKEVKFWVISNSSKWVYELVKIINRTISAFEK